MSEANTRARKAYWASMTPQERTKRMRKLAIGRQSRMSFKAKRDHALKMVEAKKKKKEKPVV